MNNINLHNYERFLLDYAEGNLPAHLVVLVENFLLQYPDKKCELVMFKDSSSKTPATGKTLYNKTSLHKNVNQIEEVTPQNVDELSIAFFEGELSVYQATKLQQALANNHHWQLNHQLVKQTFLKPDFNIVYKKKYLLKHGFFARPNLIKAASLAASFSLLVWLLNLNNAYQQTENMPVAQQFKTLATPQSNAGEATRQANNAFVDAQANSARPPSPKQAGIDNVGPYENAQPAKLSYVMPKMPELIKSHQRLPTQLKFNEQKNKKATIDIKYIPVNQYIAEEINKKANELVQPEKIF
ncbi:MAG: hypothetical protein HC896_13685 [Bacteroidales bacterium]|nr:hypothetical protein [Bacteroidales bacterium]